MINRTKYTIRSKILHRRLRRLLPSYFQLFKASLLIFITPAIIISILVIYDRITPLEGLLGIGASFLLALFFTRPYLSDLSSLTRYVQQLAKDKQADAPTLGFLSNVGELSSAVNSLHDSWQVRKLTLEAIIVESRILFDTLPDIFIMLRDNLTVIRANNAARNTFKKILKTKHISEFINDPSFNDAVEHILLEGGHQDIELFLPLPIQRYYSVRIERFPIYSPAGISLIVILHDISDTKRTEQTFTDFIANASHEMRTPLTSLIGFIETLQTSAKDDPKAQQEFLAIMAQQSDYMKKLVNDLFSLSKLQQKIHAIPSDHVVIGQVIDASINLLAPKANERSIAVTSTIEKDLPFVLGEEEDLLYLCDNILSNAIKYSNENTNVEIKAYKATELPDAAPYLQNAPSVIAIAFKDQGEGIAAASIPRLTERFYRVDKARSRHVGGTGLGLAIVKHILDRHHGTLTIESELGKGSVFTVYLPGAF